MAKIKIIFIQIILSCMLLMSCTSDITYRLGNGYVYHNEGGSLKRIFCTRAKCNIYIPPTILSYSYDNTFILAKQNPKFPRLAIEPDYSYNFDESKDSVFYWVINKKKCQLYGPLSKPEFDAIIDSLRLTGKRIVEKL